VLIEHSLGHDWATITSRAAFATDARALGIAAPETAQITELDELSAWAAGRTYPIVLKSDGSWGGRGVAIVRETAQLPRAWRKISGPPGLPRALKRMIVNLEAGYLFAWTRRAQAAVNAQEFVDGREATVTAACLDGSVRTLTCFEVVQVTEARGPAAVVRIIDHPQMEETVERLVDRYRLSGFCGFDFILTGMGEARLLEVNPRVTPTAHLLVDGRCDSGRVVTLCPSGAVPIEESGDLGKPERARAEA
jgi:biotin carboxylase